ncbi:MAG: glycosyltransferase WbuB [Betaproteobacteria bacterium]|nr:MAG: glycosyltransferase WbuB [Betaproteobacteria bacterium]
MNIWILSPHESPHGHTSRTYDYSQALLKRGHQVTVFTSSYSHRTHEELLRPGEKCRIENVDGVRVVWLRTFHYTGNGWQRGINMLSFAKQALMAARTLDEKPSVVMGDSVPPMAGWAAARIAASKGSAFVYQIRDVWPIALVYDGGLSRWSPVYFAFRAIEKYLYRRADHVCATMPFLHDHIRSSGGNPDRVTCVPNGVRLESYADPRGYDGGIARPLTVMYVGAFGVAHDVITIVRAARILKENRHLRFVIVGDGVKRTECEHEAAASGLTNVEFRAPVPKSAVPALQADADVLIACVTDSRSYQFGINLNKLYDYFASGRPVIFSGRAPNDPVAASGAGFSIPPEDPVAMAAALEKLAAMRPDERAALGRRARAYAEAHFDVRRLATVLEELLMRAVVDSRSVRG